MSKTLGKVFVVTHGYDYEGSDVVGLAKNLDAAQRIVQGIKKVKLSPHSDGGLYWRGSSEYIDVTEMEVQE